MYVVITGIKWEHSLSVYGPFESFDDARHWGERNGLPKDWAVKAIYDPAPLDIPQAP